MATRVRDVMTLEPITLPADATVADAAKAMRDADVGNVIVVDGPRVLGIVTDRDVVVRALAQERDPNKTTLEDITSQDLAAVSPNSRVAEAVELMRKKAIRRVVVLDGGRPVGIVSIGDVALQKDPNSALADISGAPANR